MNLSTALKIVFLSLPCSAFVANNSGGKAAKRISSPWHLISNGPQDGTAMEIPDSKTPPAFAKNNGSLGDPMGPDFEAEGAHPESREIIVGPQRHRVIKESAEIGPPPLNTNHSLAGPLGPSFNTEGAKPEPREVVVGGEKNQPKPTRTKGTLQDPVGPSFNTEGAHPEPREIMVGPETN